MRSVRVGDYVSDKKREIHIGGTTYGCHEDSLRIHIHYYISNDIYLDYSNTSRHSIANFLTALVMLGVKYEKY